MSVRSYVRSVAGGLLVHAALALLVSVYVLLLGAGWPSLLTLLLIWLLAAGGYYGWRFVTLRRYYRHLQQLLAELEQPYLLGSLADEPTHPELAPLWEALVAVARSVAAEVARVEQEAADHREFVEGWVHEVKAPLAAARLLADGADLLQELDRIEALVDQALFYARASAVEQDYFIRELPLSEPVQAVLRRHARQFIAHNVAVALDGLGLTVFTDRKWLEFIIAQIVLNAVKYRRRQGQAAVRIWAEPRDGGVALCIEDNGIGIPPADLGRVFDKGFTGANGRRFGRSTGIGLYLARRLCLALGHEIAVTSVPAEFTRVCIYFPQGTLLHPGEG